MPVTTGMPNFNNIDLESVNSREELMDALYAVLEEIRHIDNTIGEDNLTEELLEKINRGVDAEKRIKKLLKTSQQGRNAMVFENLQATGIVNASMGNPSITGIFNAMLPATVVTWAHSVDDAVRLVANPPVPENYGVITATKGKDNDYCSAVFVGQGGGVYIIKYSSANTAYDRYWRKLSTSTAITVSGVDDTQALQTTTTIVNLDTSNSTAVVNASDSSMSVVTKGIRCNEAGIVEISAALQANGVTAGDRLTLNINVGQTSGTSVSKRTVRWDSPATHVTGVVPPFLCEVAANDIVYLFAHNSASGGNIPTGNQTYLTVRYV